MVMTDTHTEALVERVARAIEVARLGIEFPTSEKLARAAIEALPARNDERALKLERAFRIHIWNACKARGVKDGDAYRIIEQTIDSALADTQPSQEQS
jgi:hypothetical protein